MPEIKHIVVLIMENHSFDNLFGMVPHRVPGRARVDGLTLKHGRPMQLQSATRTAAASSPSTPSSPCQLPKVPTQAWNASHQSYAGGRNDGFVRASGPVAMRFWDERDLPFTYSLVRHFPIGQRFFASTLAQTYPEPALLLRRNRVGHDLHRQHDVQIPAANGTIWDRLDAHNIDWAVYFQNLPSYLIVPALGHRRRGVRQRKFARFLPDVAAGKLPQFTFIDPTTTRRRRRTRRTSSSARSSSPRWSMR